VSDLLSKARAMLKPQDGFGFTGGGTWGIPPVLSAQPSQSPRSVGSLGRMLGKQWDSEMDETRLIQGSSFKDDM